MNYLVVLFKNKKRKKIIKSFVQKNRAESFFDKCVQTSNKVLFDVTVENAKKVNYELAIISSVDEFQLSLFKQDYLGRNIEINLSDSDLKIIKIDRYYIPEKIYDCQKNKRITFEDFWDLYFKTKELKNIFTLNNKLIIQIDESINVFSLKNIDESKRLMSTIQEYMVDSKRADGLFVKDTDTIHRKYLYGLLEKNGFDKKKFYRQSTTFSERR